jgi:hypothetical protein
MDKKGEVSRFKPVQDLLDDNKLVNPFHYQMYPWLLYPFILTNLSQCCKNQVLNVWSKTKAFQCNMRTAKNKRNILVRFEPTNLRIVDLKNYFR